MLPEASVAVRIPDRYDTPRPMEYIHTEEVAAAMIEIIKHSFGITTEDLSTECARVFGFERKGPKIKQKTDAAIEFLVKTGKMKLIDGKAQLVGGVSIKPSVPKKRANFTEVKIVEYHHSNIESLLENFHEDSIKEAGGINQFSFNNFDFEKTFEANQRAMAKLIYRIATCEAPIHLEYLTHKIKNAYEGGERIVDICKDIRIICEKYCADTIEIKQGFLYLKNNEITLRSQKDNNKIQLDYVCDEELSLCVKYVLN